MEESEELIENSFVHTDSDSSDEESMLQIVEESPKTPKKRKFEKINFAGSELLDHKIDELTDKCKNFTPEVAKKILMKLVKNEHVLALSLLKAEEEAEKEKRKTSESEEDGTRSEPDQPTTPKLTRLKAKQLNTTLPIPGSLNSTQPDEEVVALINEELRSDDEDDEYQPCEDDAISDEEFTNTTMSDIDSMPSTPGSALINHEIDVSPTKSGEFKVPRPKLTLEEQETISRRTRSKLCLTTTPIETIESTFIPPDITTDMYDFEQEQEVDNEWKEFLSEFMMPLTNAEEDDAEDPEYVASENAKIDKEELRPVRVSKKELNQLISELLEDSVNFMNMEEEATPTWSRKSQESASKKNRMRISSPIQYSKSPKIKSNSNDSMLNTPPISRIQEIPTTPIRKDISIDQCDKSFVQIPNQLYETPQKLSQPTTSNEIGTPKITMNSPQTFLTPQITGVYGSHLQNISPQILVVNSHNQLELVPPTSILKQAFDNNGIVQLPQYQSVVIQVPTVDLLQNRINISNIIDSPKINRIEESVQTETIENEEKIDESDDIDIPIEQKVVDLKLKSKRFDEFKDLESQTPVECVFPANSIGFTQQQFQLYEQQMRIHAQLLTQNYVQVYSRPNLWTKAEGIKQQLYELKEVVKPDKSPLNSEHIKNCIETCETWEAELEENNERNKKYAEFLYEELEYDEEAAKKKRYFNGRFHPRLMEHLLNSKAILYPSLLPHKPFRCFHSRFEALNSEIALIAFFIGRIYPEMYAKVNNSRKKPREPTTNEITTELLQRLGPIRTERQLNRILDKFRSFNEMNPIKYVFKHKRYPRIELGIEEIDLNKILPPVRLRRGLLPKKWDAYMFDHKRLEKHPYQPAYEEKTENVVITENEEIVEIQEIEEIVNVNKSAPVVKKIDNSFQFEFIFDETPKINISILPTESPEKDSELVSCTRLLSPVKLDTSQEKHLTSILKKGTEKDSTKKKSVNFLLPTPNEDKFLIPFSLSQKFFIIIENFFNSYSKNFKFKRSKNNLLPKVFVRARNFDIYLQLVKISIKMSRKKTNESGDVPVKSKRSVTQEEFTLKLKKRLIATRESIMETDMNKCTVEKDCSFSYNYLERVKNALMENGDDDLFAEFMTTLRTFDPNQQSVPDLYYKIESLFQENYADLVDLFISFLLPEHAAEIGKFFENFILNNMQNLIKKLNIVFNKQPSQIKKVLVCLNELSNERDVTIDILKERLFPLLKGNQLLIDWFTQLFDKPPDCPLSEYETLNLKRYPSDDSSEESYEEISCNDLIKCRSIDEMRSCGVRYRNGKIYYYCGTLLPAKISFLANDAKMPPTIPTKEVKQSLCVHEIRKHVKFNESKKVEEKETNENSKKTSKKKNKKENTEKKVKKKPKLCDTNTLHAHYVRLNPVHAQNGEKLSDLMRYLTPDSPRKRKKNTTSPKKNEQSPTNESSTTILQSPPSPSKTSNGVKIKLEDTSTSSDEPLKKKLKTSEESIPIPRVTTTIVSASTFSSKKPRIEFPATSKKDVEEKKKTVDLRSSENWTRDEDKIILEEIKNGYDDPNELIIVLLSKLKRTRQEIRQRHEFLLDLVRMMN